MPPLSCTSLIPLSPHTLSLFPHSLTHILAPLSPNTLSCPTLPLSCPTFTLHILSRPTSTPILSLIHPTLISRPTLPPTLSPISYPPYHLTLSPHSLTLIPPHTHTLSLSLFTQNSLPTLFFSLAPVSPNTHTFSRPTLTPQRLYLAPFSPHTHILSLSPYSHPTHTL